MIFDFSLLDDRCYVVKVLVLIMWGRLYFIGVYNSLRFRLLFCVNIRLCKIIGWVSGVRIEEW